MLMNEKRGYTNYSNKFQNSKEETTPVEEVNFKNWGDRVTAEETVNEEAPTVEEVNIEGTVEEKHTEPVIATGTVNCKHKLNVRRMPKKDSTVVCVISNDDTVKIDLEKSTHEWYKVYTSAGVEGFCMKDFITL